MPDSKRILLLTGYPGVGKTTVIRKVVENLPDNTSAGFYTEEIRIKSVRQGFELVTFKGEKSVIAHTGISSVHRVGKYGVDVAAIDAAAKSTLLLDLDIDIYIVDEIGKMECFSRQFIQAMEALLDSKKIIVATVALKGGGFISKIKKRNDIELWEVTPRNRDSLPVEVLSWIKGTSLINKDDPHPRLAQ